MAQPVSPSAAATTPARRTPVRIVTPRDGARHSSESPPPSPSALQQGAVQAQTQGQAQGQGVILRIKRKRGAEPVDALRIGQLLDEAEAEAGAGDEGSSQQEPRDGERKRRMTEKPQGAGHFFRLAETVSMSAFSDPTLAQGLSDRLAARNSRPVPSPAAEEDPAPPGSRASPPRTPMAERAADGDAEAVRPAALRFQVVRNARSGGLGFGAFASPGAGGAKMGKRRVEGRLRRVGSDASLSSVGSVRRGKSRTPKSGTPLSRMRIIDAIAIDAADETRRRRRAERTDDDESEMAKLDRRFADMLGDYLAEKDLVPPVDLYTSAKSPQLGSSPSDAVEQADDDDEYVYDVYYREREGWGSGPAGRSDSGMHPLAVPGHDGALGTDALPDPLAPLSAATGMLVPAERAPMATLEGLRAADLESDDELEVEDEGSEEWDEGEDEDSNDEGFYRNDYPDNEGPDSEEEMNGWAGEKRSDSEEEESDDNDMY